MKRPPKLLDQVRQALRALVACPTKLTEINAITAADQSPAATPSSPDKAVPAYSPPKTKRHSHPPGIEP